MRVGTTARVEVLRALVLAGPAARADLTPDECDLLVETCASVAGMSDILPGGTVGERGRAAYDGVALLLDLGCPRVDPALRQRLAAVVAAVVRRSSPAA